MDQAILHRTRGIGIWDWASNDQDGEPDVVMACCGDSRRWRRWPRSTCCGSTCPTSRSASSTSSSEHPHGLSDPEFDALFTTNRPIVFAYHGYPWLIHRLTYRRTNHDNLHVRGYKEEGTTTTPFDMVMLNDLDRFHLVMDVIDRVPGLASRAGHVRQLMVDRRLECRDYTRRVGDDAPEIRDWTWGGSQRG
jgi:xylulose-5-phosphate/fructose-6-phosphate phosphoketolase